MNLQLLFLLPHQLGRGRWAAADRALATGGLLLIARWRPVGCC